MENGIILVNENDEQIGIAEKMEAHRKALLHRAFSIFIFNSKNEMLLQQRAISKYHSGGLWTNTCCSHPIEGEENKVGAEKRLFEEMGFTTELTKIFHFTYKHQFENGLTEYEFDHVFTGFYDGQVYVNEHEASDYCYMNLSSIESSLSFHPKKFSAWFHIAFPMIKKWFEESGKLKIA